MKKALEVENSNENLIIRFNRPDIRSPLSISVLEEIDKILDEAANRSGIRKLIFTGRQDVFASGADLREIAEVTADTAKDFSLQGQNLMSKIANSEKMTIAAINGFCFGGALDLALSCKKRIAAENAQFCHPGVGLGIMTGWGGTQRLPRLIGEAYAMEIFLTAKRIDAIEALRIGLIDLISAEPLSAAVNLS